MAWNYGYWQCCCYYIVSCSLKQLYIWVTSPGLSYFPGKAKRAVWAKFCSTLENALLIIMHTGNDLYIVKYDQNWFQETRIVACIFARIKIKLSLVDSNQWWHPQMCIQTNEVSYYAACIEVYNFLLTMGYLFHYSMFPLLFFVENLFQVLFSPCFLAQTYALFR